MLCSSYLGWLRGVQSSGPTAKKRAGRKGKKAAALDTDEDEAMDVDQEHPSPLASSLAGFAGSLRTLGLADQPDVVQDAASTCVDVRWRFGGREWCDSPCLGYPHCSRPDPLSQPLCIQESLRLGFRSPPPLPSSAPPFPIPTAS